MAKVEKVVPGNQDSNGTVPTADVQDLLLAKLEELFPAVQALEEKVGSIPGVVKQILSTLEGFEERLQAVEKVALKVDLNVAPAPPKELYKDLTPANVWCTAFNAAMTKQFEIYASSLANKPAMQDACVRTAVDLAFSAVRQVTDRLPDLNG